MKSLVASADAPAAIGPYSQAVLVPAGAQLLFCSGQIALDPLSGQLVGAGDVQAQARRVMDNLGAVLGAGGASFSTVIRTTIYLVSMSDFAAVNEVYGSYFTDGKPPARATVAVAGLPRGALVEIDAVALVG
jgi:2-iminobutanoate/2-iminopropanoate deaminase